MADSLIGPDLDLAADIGSDLAAQVALDLVGTFDVVAQGEQLVVGQILDADVRVDARGGEGLGRTRASDTVDVRESDLHALIAWNIDSGKTGHDGSFRWVRGVEQIRCPSLPPGVSPALAGSRTAWCSY